METNVRKLQNVDGLPCTVGKATSKISDTLGERISEIFQKLDPIPVKLVGATLKQLGLQFDDLEDALEEVCPMAYSRRTLSLDDFRDLVSHCSQHSKQQVPMEARIAWFFGGKREQLLDFAATELVPDVWGLVVEYAVPSSIPVLAEGLRDDVRIDWEHRLQCTTWLRELLSVENAPIKEVMRAGALARLIENIAVDELRLESLRCIVNLACGSADIILTMLLRHDVLRLTATLLNHHDFAVRTQAVWLMGNLTATKGFRWQPNNRRLAKGVYSAVLEYIELCPRTAVAEFQLAVWALWNVCHTVTYADASEDLILPLARGFTRMLEEHIKAASSSPLSLPSPSPLAVGLAVTAEHKQRSTGTATSTSTSTASVALTASAVDAGPGVHVHSYVLYPMTEECLVYALTGLSALASDHTRSSPKTDAVVKSGCLPHVISFLSHASTAVLFPSVRVLQSVAKCAAVTSQLVFDLGGVLPISRLLSHPDVWLRREAVWTLSNLMSGTPEQMGAVLSTPGFMPQVIAIMRADGPLKLRREAAWTMTETASSYEYHADHVVALVLNHDVISAWCAMLDCTDAKLVRLALDGLIHVQNADECELFDQPDYFKKAITARLGVEKLEALRLQRKVFEPSPGQEEADLEAISAKASTILQSISDTHG